MKLPMSALPLVLMTVAASGAGAAPFELSPTALDTVTAGQATMPNAAVQALADANGQYAQTSTYTTAEVKAFVPAGYPAGATTYLTVTGGTAMASGAGGTSSTSTSVDSVNEQPFSDTYYREINYSRTTPTASLSFQSSYRAGGHPINNFFDLRTRFR